MMQIYDGRKSFYQWDLDQKVTSPDLVVGDEVHFYNMTLTKALVVKAYVLDGVVVADVPNIILQEALAIKVYHYVTDKDSKRTREEYKFAVTARAKPEDYIYTETDILTVKYYVDAAMLEAKESGDFDGDDGIGISKITADVPGQIVITLENGESITVEIPTVRGEDGHTPYIGENGNWWIGDTDTEIRAEGKDADASKIVPRMSVIDEADENNAVENYKDGKTFPDTYNRVYVEMTEGRGVYSRYCLTSVDAPKDPDPEDYAEGKTLDSIPMRMSNGYIMSPIIRANDVEALAKLAELGYNTDYYLMPKSYIDSLVGMLFTIGEGGGLKHGNGAENTGKCNLSIGVNTKASAAQASAFGDATEATAWTAFAINRSNKAKNAHSFVGGIGNESSRDGQSVLGRYANPDANYNFLVGVGESETKRVNGFGVMWDGRVLIGKDPTADMHAVPKHLLDELGTAILEGLDSIVTAQTELLGG